MPIPLKNRPADHPSTEVVAGELRPTILSVNLNRVASNALKLMRHADDRPLLGVVKANAYGMGAIPVAKTLRDAGAKWLGVALPEEGVELRRAGIKLPILMLGPVSSAQVPLLIAENITPAVHSILFLEKLEEQAGQRGIIVAAHLKVDSGMGRVGFRSEEIPRLTEALRKAPHVRIEGLFSNLASADNPSSPQTAKQVDTFLSIRTALEAEGISPRMVHLANSSGLLAHPSTRLSICRPGLALYGILPSSALPDIGLESAVTFTTRISQVKHLPAGTPVGYGGTYVTEGPRRIGILPVGYGDGLPRILGGGKGRVIVNGKSCPIVGRVSMDLVAIDLGGDEDAREGSPVILWGGEKKNEITPWDWARWSGTIPYEITTGIANRVAREYSLNGRSWYESELLQREIVHRL